MELNAEVILPEDISIGKFSKDLSKKIIERFEKSLIYKIIDREIPLSNQEDKTKVYQIALKNASKESGELLSEIYYNRRLALIEESVKKYFDENDHMVLEGFVNFRLKAYMEELKTLCINAMEEFSAQREYEEFIDMLRFFVSVQNPREEMVNVVKKGQEMRILNKRRKDITDLYMDELVNREEELTKEDVILSELITIAPQRIVIHDDKNAEKIYETISQIFKDVTYV